MKIKEYDSITIACQYKDNDGFPLSLDGVDIKSELRTQHNVIIDKFVVTVTDKEQGLFHMRPTKKRLPVGILIVDVMFSKNGYRISSETFQISVIRAVTRGVSNA